MTPKEQAETDFANAQRDKIYLEGGVVPEYTIAKELKQRQVYTNITDEHIEELEEFENAFESNPDEIEPGNQQEEQGGEEETGEPGEESEATGGEIS